MGYFRNIKDFYRKVVGWGVFVEKLYACVDFSSLFYFFQAILNIYIQYEFIVTFEPSQWLFFRCCFFVCLSWSVQIHPKRLLSYLCMYCGCSILQECCNWRWQEDYIWVTNPSRIPYDISKNVCIFSKKYIFAFSWILFSVSQQSSVKFGSRWLA